MVERSNIANPGELRDSSTPDRKGGVVPISCNLPFRGKLGPNTSNGMHCVGGDA